MMTQVGQPQGRAAGPPDIIGQRHLPMEWGKKSCAGEGHQGEGPVSPQAAEALLPSGDPACVLQLSLGFRNLALAPPGLAAFTQLTSLALNNNRLASVDGLSGLTSLQRLDLSLNAITHARGLSRLTALEDLSLFGNRISSVDGLAQLSALRALSLGNNQLRAVESLAPLRRLLALRVLTVVEGNPLGADAGAACSWLLAHLPRLLYLDHCLVGAEERRAAVDLHMVEVLALAEQDARRADDVREAAEAAARAARLAGCGLSGAAALLREEAPGSDWPRLRSIAGLCEGWPDCRDRLLVTLESCQVRLAQRHQAAAAALRGHRQDGRALVEAAEGEARRLTAEGDALLKRARKAALFGAGAEAATEALELLAAAEARLAELAAEGAEAEAGQLAEFEELARGQGEAAAAVLASTFEALEQGLGVFWEGVGAAVAAVQARLERRSAAGEALPEWLQAAAAGDKDCLPTVVAQAQRAQLGRLAELRAAAEGAKRARVEQQVVAERAQVEARAAARSREVQEWAQAVRVQLQRLAVEPPPGAEGCRGGGGPSAHELRCI